MKSRVGNWINNNLVVFIHNAVGMFERIAPAQSIDGSGGPKTCVLTTTNSAYPCLPTNQTLEVQTWSCHQILWSRSLHNVQSLRSPHKRIVAVAFDSFDSRFKIERSLLRWPSQNGFSQIRQILRHHDWFPIKQSSRGYYRYLHAAAFTNIWGLHFSIEPSSIFIF